MRGRVPLRCLTALLALALAVGLASPATAADDVATAQITGVLAGTTGHGSPTFEEVIAEDLDGKEIAYAFTNEDGRFTLDVPQGTPVRLLADPSAWYEPGYYTSDGGPTTVRREDATTVVSPAAIGTVQLGLFPMVSGVVVGDDGGYVGQIEVRTYDAATGSPLGGTVTDDTGHFEVRARTGRQVVVKVEMVADYVDGYFVADGARTSDDESSAAGVDAPTDIGTLTLVSRPTVTGRVTEAGTPVVGEYVTATPAADGSQGAVASTAVTAADGTYRLRNLVDGTRYIIQFAAHDNVLGGWYGGPGHPVSRRGESSSPVTAPASGVDADTPLAASISGAVSAIAGTDFRYVSVSAREVISGDVQYPPSSSVRTDGTFTLSGLWPGAQYRICFDVSQIWQSLVPGCFSTAGAPLVGSGAATPVTAPTSGLAMTMLNQGPPLGLTPTLAGTPRVGSPLTLGQGGFAWADVGYRYQWLRRGTPIVGATSRTYVPTSADLAAVLAVRVTSEFAGYTSTSFVVTAPKAVAKGSAPTVRSAPSITGTTAVGHRLSARPGTWSMSGLTFAYQWFRDGSAIARATGSSYTVTTADIGSRIAVRITAARADREPATASSARTGAVPRVAPTVRVTVADKTLTTHQHGHITVRVSTTRGVSVQGAVTIRYGKTSKTVRLSSAGTAKITLPTLARGPHTIRATYKPTTGASKRVFGGSASATLTVR